MTTRLAPLCALFLATACVEDVSVSEVSQGAGCSKFICGSNSPILGGLPFFELDQLGVKPAPDSGLRIVGFFRGGVPLKVRVIKATLGGMKPDGTLLQGTDLVGSKLYVENAEGVVFQVNFESFARNQPYWEGGNDGTMLESWGLSYNQLPVGGSPPRKLCPIVASTAEFTTPPHHALIFRGDRYDVDSGQVSATGKQAGSWFNVACAGDVLSKLLVTRHAEAAQDAAHKTTSSQRTAAIRMFRADYCATGPNTALGIPLDWANVGGWNTLAQAPTKTNVEAIWRADGAYCVSNPRYIDIDDVECAPKCSQWDLDHWKQLGDFITVNP